jgi:acyl carrier protein
MLKLPFLSHTVTTAEATDTLVRLQQRLPHMLGGADRRTLVSQLPIDSLDLVELLCATEVEFDVRLTNDELMRARTVGDLTDLIARRARRKKEAR